MNFQTKLNCQGSNPEISCHGYDPTETSNDHHPNDLEPAVFLTGNPRKRICALRYDMSQGHENGQNVALDYQERFCDGHLQLCFRAAAHSYHTVFRTMDIWREHVLRLFYLQIFIFRGKYAFPKYSVFEQTF